MAKNWIGILAFCTTAALAAPEDYLFQRQAVDAAMQQLRGALDQLDAVIEPGRYADDRGTVSNDYAALGSSLQRLNTTIDADVTLPPPPPPDPQGSALEMAAAALAPGDAGALAMGGLSAELFQISVARTIFEYVKRGYYRDGLVHFVGQPRTNDSQRRLIYTEAIDQWQLAEAAPTLPAPGHAYEHFAVDPLTGQLALRDWNSGRLLRYNGAAWNAIDEGELEMYAFGLYNAASALEYFPAMGLVFFDWYTGPFLHDGSEWRAMTDSNGDWFAARNHPQAVYLPRPNVMLFGGGTGSSQLWRVDAAGLVTQVADAPAEFGSSPGIGTLLADPSPAGDALLFESGAVWRYQAAADAWTTIDTYDPYTGLAGEGFLVSIPRHGVVLNVKNGEIPTAELYRPPN